MRKSTSLIRRGCALVISVLIIAGIVISPSVALSQEIVEMDLAAAILRWNMFYSKIAEHTLEQGGEEEGGRSFCPR